MMVVGEIKRILPHRYPMLLVDRVDEIVPHERLTARKAVTANEPWYATCDDPAYPFALLIESWCQAAGVLAAHDQPNPDVREGKVMLFGSVSDASFDGRVVPGDVLVHEVRLVRALTDAIVVEGEARVDGKIVLSVGRAVMALRPAEELDALKAAA